MLRQRPHPQPAGVLTADRHVDLPAHVRRLEVLQRLLQAAAQLIGEGLLMDHVSVGVVPRHPGRGPGQLGGEQLRVFLFQHGMALLARGLAAPQEADGGRRSAAQVGAERHGGRDKAGRGPQPDWRRSARPA